MQLEHHPSISILIGNPDAACNQKAWKPFDERVTNYLAELSRRLLATSSIREFPDLVSLAFWCRPSALHRLQERHIGSQFLIGRGMAFHIPPSNVPLNFAYSLFCGLLSGNSNVVRLSSTESAEVSTLVDLMSELNSDVAFGDVASRMCLLRYEHNDAITELFSLKSAARVIWGGNETVRKIRGIPSAPRSVDVSFADRVSLALLKSSHIEKLSEEGLTQLVDNFIADGYTFEQNACSSPRLILWQGSDDSVSKASSMFWNALDQRLSLKETLSPAHHMLRFVELCEHLSQNDLSGRLVNVAGAATRIELSGSEQWRNFSQLRFGTFTEVTISSLNEVADFVSGDVQTLAYCGFSTTEMSKMIDDLCMDGVDRVVPIGQALNFDVFWDGYDLISTLARTVVII